MPQLRRKDGWWDMMTLQKAIKMLESEYERARKLAYVRNPLAYALYYVWKRADKERTKE